MGALEMTRRFLQLLARAATTAVIFYVGGSAGLMQERQDRESGAYLYRVFCAACHGDDGKGKGPAADGLRQSVPDLTVLSRNAGGVFPRDRVLKAIQTGGPTAAHVPGGMPTWSEAFARLEPSRGTAQKRIQSLVDHVESLQVKEW
jgi:mono/diheme cytochrome c family protein